MKRFLILASCIGCLTLGAPASAQNTEFTIESQESSNLFTTLFRSVWAGLNAINPQSRIEARSTHVATAGIRGAESTYGPHSHAHDAREVVVKIALHHDSREALSAIVRELGSFGMAVPGLTAGGRGLPKPTPLVRLSITRWSRTPPGCDRDLQRSLSATLGVVTLAAPLPSRLHHGRPAPSRRGSPCGW